MPGNRQKPPDGLRLETSVKALIVREGSVLTIRKSEGGREFVVLPGGSQEPGEALDEALQREVREETGATVEVEELAFVRDYIAPHHGFPAAHPGLHRVELCFRCRLVDEPATHEANHRDTRQVGMEWLPVEQLESRPFYPRTLGRILASGGEGPVYLGDVN